MPKAASTLCILLVIGLTAPLTAGDWPAFRGPHGDGMSDEQQLPLAWGPEKNVRWKVPLAAPGNSSPIVSAGKVFVTVAEDRGHQRHLLCFDRVTGQQLWTRTVRYEQDERTHDTNPYCGSTPVTDGVRVVVWHSSAGLFCYDHAGEELWSLKLGAFDHIWGYGSSPILHEGKVILLTGPGERTMLVAVGLQDGKVLWETPEPGGSASDGSRYVGTWGTPLMAEVDGRQQLLIGLHSRVGAFDPVDGKLLWFVTGVSSERSDLCYTCPLTSNGVGVVLGGYGGPALGFTLGGSGDVTDRNLLWRNFSTAPRNPQRIGSAIALGEHVFLANADNEGSIECFDLRTGQQRWEERRTPDGPHWGSMLFAAGRLYASGQKGITRVLAPNPDQYEVLAENDLGERSNSTPAFSEGEIFLRTFEHLYCISETAP
jgi:outer membrane protein assembly factor BamB